MQIIGGCGLCTNSVPGRGHIACSNHYDFYHVPIHQGSFLISLLVQGNLLPMVRVQILLKIWCLRTQRSISFDLTGPRARTCRWQIRGMARLNSAIHQIKICQYFVLAGWGQSAKFNSHLIFRLYGISVDLLVVEAIWIDQRSKVSWSTIAKIARSRAAIAKHAQVRRVAAAQCPTEV